MQQIPVKRFDTATFLAFIRPEKKVMCFSEKQIIFSEGERSDSLFYIEKGTVKLTVTSRHGKEAIIGVFYRGDFFGESCIASDQPVRLHNAVALSEVRALKIARSTIIPVLLRGGDACYGFVTYLLGRNTRMSVDLVNNLMDSSEERLARALFLLARSGKADFAARISQQTLAEMIGTTRQRVNVLMKRFKKLGLIEYGHGLKVHEALRSIFKND
jgi:CRP/FNR family transcriptional regulator, cyclic AMP receptor protein